MYLVMMIVKITKSNHQHKKHQGWWRVIITIVTMRWIWYEYQHSSTSNTGLFPITMLTVGGFNIVQVLFVIGLIGSSQVGNKPLNGIIGSGLMDIDGHWWTSFWWKSLKFVKPNWSLTNFCHSKCRFLANSQWISLLVGKLSCAELAPQLCRAPHPNGLFQSPWIWMDVSSASWSCGLLRISNLNIYLS